MFKFVVEKEQFLRLRDFLNDIRMKDGECVFFDFVMSGEKLNVKFVVGSREKLTEMMIDDE